MHKIFLSYITAGLVGLFMLMISQNVFSAELIFKQVPNTVAGDNTTIIEARIDPQAKVLNVIDGTINFQEISSGDLSVEVLTDGSVLTIWPIAPIYFPNNKAIRFTGGVPNGFDKEGLLFRMRLTSSLNSNVIVSWVGGTAYLNDGKGTKESIFSKPLEINLGGQNLDIVSKILLNKKYLYSAIIILILVVVCFVFYKYAPKKFFKK